MPGEWKAVYLQPYKCEVLFSMATRRSYRIQLANLVNNVPRSVIVWLTLWEVNYFGIEIAEYQKKNHLKKRINASLRRKGGGGGGGVLVSIRINPDNQT